MAVTYTLQDPAPGYPIAAPGQTGGILCRLILDGSVTSKAITLPANASIKTIKGVIGTVTVASNGIGTAGVAGTTGLTATFAAGTSGHALDVILIGDGK